MTIKKFVGVSLVAVLSFASIAGATTHTFTKTLRQGSRGADVKNLQAFLNMCSDTTVSMSGAGSKGMETTSFGPATRRAVIAFQRKNGVPATGTFGPLSAAAAAKAQMPGANPCTPVSTGTTTGGTTTGGTTTGGTTTVSGPVTVSLSSNNPASGNYPVTQNGTSSQTKFTTFNFSAGASDAVVTGITFTRGGLASDNNIQNLYLMDGSTVIATSLGIGNSKAMFQMAGGLFTVKAGTTKEITLAGDVTSIQNSQNLKFGIASGSDVVVAGGAAGGSYPIWGNDMYGVIVSNPNLATLNVQPVPTGSSVDSGSKGYIAGQFSLQGNNSTISVKSIKLTQNGTINNATDLSNLQLRNGATVLATAPAINSDGTVVFNLSANPLQITAGQTAVLSVVADITGGVYRNFNFTIQRSYDIVSTDMTYNAGAAASCTASADCDLTISSTQTNFPVRMTSVNINQGSLTLTRATDSPSNTISTGVSNQTLAKFNLNAAGEAVRFSALNFQLVRGISAAASTDFNNLKLVDDQGVQIGTIYTSDTTVGTTTSVPLINLNYIIPANTTRTLMVKADILANATASQTFTASITSGTGQGFTSLNSITIGSASGLPLSISANPFTQGANTGFGSSTYVAGASSVKVGSFVLAAGTGEGVNVSTITVTSGAGVTASSVNKFQNLKVMVGTTQFGQNQATVAASTAYTFSGASAIAVPAGQSVVLDVYADTVTSATLGAITAPFSLTSAVGSGMVSGTSRPATGTATGQNITLAGNGSLVVSSDTNTASATNVAMGSSTVILGSFKVTTGTNEGINLTSIRAKETLVGSNAVAALSNIRLMDGQTTVGQVSSLDNTSTGCTVTPCAFFQFSPVLAIPANTTKTYTVVADISAYNSTASTSGTTNTLSVAGADIVSNGSGSGASITASGTATGNTITVLRTTLSAAVSPNAPTGTRTVSTADDFQVFRFTAGAGYDAILNSFVGTLTVPTTSVTPSMTVRDSNGAITGSSVSCAPISSGTTSTCTVTLPANYTINAGGSRDLTLRLNTVAAVATTVNQDAVGFQITSVLFNDQGGTSAAPLPANLLPVNGNTLLY